MTSLLLLILSIFIALGFARYNKSNKLFWIILVSLLLGFTGKSMVNSAFVDHKSEASTVKSSATPMLAPTCSLQALEPSEGAGTCDEPKPAGKDNPGNSCGRCAAGCPARAWRYPASPGRTAWFHRR